MFNTPNRTRAILISLFLAGATLAIYWPVGGYEFNNFDDQDYVYENPIVQKGLTLNGAVWAFTTDMTGNWHPLTWLSHMLDCQLFGVNPGSHHWVNAGLHLANTLLLFLVLTRMTGSLERSGFVAALFALHPLHVESVAWIAERKDLLSAFFWIVTVGAYVEYAKRPRPWRYFVVVLLFLLGLLSKPMVVTLPCVLLLLDFWPLNRMRWNDLAAPHGVSAPNSQSSPGAPPFLKAPNLRNLVMEKLPLFALAAVSCVITFLVQQKGGAVGSLEKFPISVRLGNAVVAYARYIGKTIWPEDLAVLYPHPGAWPLWMIFGASIFLLCVSLLVLALARPRPYFLVGWLWFLGTLVPVIGLVQVGAQSMADRYTYLPLIGLFIAASWGLGDLLASRKVPSTAVAGGAVLLFAVLAMVSASQVKNWQSSITLFTHALETTTNNPIAHYNLAQSLSEKGHVAEAMPHYTEALRLKPNYDAAHNNMGLSLVLMGRMNEATNHYEEAIRINPRNRAAHLNYGLALASLGDFTGAASHFGVVLQISPDDPEAHVQLGLALSAQHKTPEAIAQYREALRLNPGHVGALNNLAWMFATSPDAAHRNGQEAVQLAERACRLTSFKLPVFVGTLAAAYAEAGDFEQAAKTAEQACALAKSSGQAELAASNQKLLALYQLRKPYREQ